VKPLQVLIRDTAAPILRARGFTRSGGTFRAVDELGVALIALSAGKGGIGTHDLDFFVELGFATHEQLASEGRPEAPERIDITHTYGTWHSRLRDPGLTAMDLNDRWRFDQGDVAMHDLFAKVLAMAADDVLERLRRWPEEPTDSLSRRPVFREPVEWETRSRWQTAEDGRLDLHYSASAPVRKRTGSVGSTEFGFDVLYDELSVMINLDPEALDLLAGGRSLAIWAAALGFHSASGYPTLPLVAPPDAVWLRDAAATAVLEIRPEHDPEARLNLGDLPQPQWGYINQHRWAQIVLVAGEPGTFESLTWHERNRLADAGQVWFATVRSTPDPSLAGSPDGHHSTAISS
jgi:hypothetical protein